ncbi:MAG: site-specific integrase [Planctomycetaceae bacterium]|nr:site-specific integrase [Planctomycetaceae bacterium]
MPKLKNRLPKNCRDRNQAFSWYDGKRIYHGVWGSPEAEKNYKRFIAALLESPALPLQAEGDSLPIGGGSEVLVSEIAIAFLDSIESQMDKNEYMLFKYAVGYLVEVYGELAVNDFSPKKLKIIRSRMVSAGTLCRNTINKYIGKIRRIFSWGVGEEVVQSTIADALKAVKDLRKGEDGTFDHLECEAVPEWVIAATLPFLPPVVAVMVMVQYLTGMRPSEVFKMRVGDIDQSRDNGLWYYSPKHKTEVHIGKKPIPLGKSEQKLIAPYLVGKKPVDSIFSPKTAQRERAAEARANRKSKRTPSQRARDAQRAEQNASKVGEFYNRGSYRNAVKYAIEKGNRHGVKIPHWSPYQLRKSAATAIELEHGLDEAQAQLGHTSADMTKRYSKAQLKQREKLAHSRVNPFEKPAE